MPDETLAFTRYFAALPDPRVNRTKKHTLHDILGVTFCAVICGADSFEEIARFGEARQDWLKRFFALENGIPSHDTFNRVLAALDHNVFATCFAQWMVELSTTAGLNVIAIDGKACRSAPRDTFSGCLHLVNAWATENNLFLGSVAVADGSNEITAVPELLKVLDLKGALVTLDAGFCQTEILAQIRERGGDYVVTVKGNQPALHRAVVGAFEQAAEAGFEGCAMASGVEDGHGRHEERYVTVIRNPEGLPDGWADARAVVMVGRERMVAGKNTSSAHFYLTSLRLGAKKLGGFIRGHWGVENGCHWCLDIAFAEDDNRTRDTNAGANLGVVRRVALSLLKQDTTRGSIKAKRLTAAWDDKYLQRVLQGFKTN
jgi:predicted transposase YbfD/YdcC